MGILSELNPAPIWIYFEEICKIPRLSKNEEKIRKYLLEFATRNNLSAKEDSVGNSPSGAVNFRRVRRKKLKYSVIGWANEEDVDCMRAVGLA